MMRRETESGRPSKGKIDKVIKYLIINNMIYSETHFLTSN